MTKNSDEIVKRILYILQLLTFTMLTISLITVCYFLLNTFSSIFKFSTATTSDFSTFSIFITALATVIIALVSIVALNSWRPQKTYEIAETAIIKTNDFLLSFTQQRIYFSSVPVEKWIQPQALTTLSQYIAVTRVLKANIHNEKIQKDIDLLLKTYDMFYAIVSSYLIYYSKGKLDEMPKLKYCENMLFNYGNDDELDKDVRKLVQNIIDGLEIYLK